MRIVYYASTLLFTGFYAFSIFGYVTDGPYWAAEYERLGYPGYLIAIMTGVKLAGIVAVWVRRPVWLAQLAYAGFFYHTLLAANAHFQLGEMAGMLALVLLALAVISFLTQNAARTPPAPYI